MQFGAFWRLATNFSEYTDATGNNASLMATYLRVENKVSSLKNDYRKDLSRVLFRDGNGSSFMTHDPWPITSLHPTHGTRRGRGMVVLDNPLGLENKKS